jgi:hypothetical protein
MDQDSTESRIKSLQQAMELLLYHTQGNERVDEFLETFLSMHVDKTVAIRRFAAHFIEMLCLTRSRFACSCLEVLVTLLQDNDKQVLVFALRATRVVYKRALYWISLQQKDPKYLQAARESLQTLDFILARVVHLITSSHREVFCEAIRCVQVVVLSQSLSLFAARSQSELEVVGCTCLEDLRLTDSTALDEGKLKPQADRLFTALCALLIKRKDELSLDQLETVALIRSVGVIGHSRANYTGAAVTALASLVTAVSLPTRIQSSLTAELKRILSSRHCVEFQPQIIPILEQLGVATAGSSALIMEAELARMKEQLEPEKIKKINGGEYMMRMTDLVDTMKVPEESHAVSVCSVRAQSSSELARVALAMLGKLPKKIADDSVSAIQRVNRADVASGGTHAQDARVSAIRSMGLDASCFLTADAEEEIIEPPSVTPSILSMDEISQLGSSLIIPSLIQRTKGDKSIFLKLASLKADDPVAMVKQYVQGLSSRDPTAMVDLFSSVFRGEMGAVDEEQLGCVIAEVATESGKESEWIGKLKVVVNQLPVVTDSILDFIDHAIKGSVAETRRTGLTILSSLIGSKPGISDSCLDRLLGHACGGHEVVRTDALKLLVAKVYKPFPNSLLDGQWPYKDPESPLEIVKSDRSVSMVEKVCADHVEVKCRERFLQALSSKDNANQAWPMLAICSKKPVLIHSVCLMIIEDTNDTTLPEHMIKAFADSLLMLPGDVIDKELELVATEFKGVRAAMKKRKRNELMLPILSAISNSSRGLTEALSNAAMAFAK